MSFALDHQWAPDRMSDFLDGDLGTSERGRMEHHLGACAECRRLLAGLRAVVDGLHRLPALARDADAVQIAASVCARLTEPPPR
jgi:anti-sigma factor RsiW